MVHQWAMVVVFVVIGEVFALVVDFSKVMGPLCPSPPYQTLLPFKSDLSASLMTRNNNDSTLATIEEEKTLNSTYGYSVTKNT